jgi:putative transposase
MLSVGQPSLSLAKLARLQALPGRPEIMPQSLARVVVHLIFSTKNRAPIIPKQIQPELHAYLGGLLANLGCIVIRVGGVSDHIHALFGLPRTSSLADLVEILKRDSSKWVKEKCPASPDFYWQKGYGVFSVSQTHTSKVATYIANQEAHHQTISFQDEYRQILRKNDVPFDERYVWE